MAKSTFPKTFPTSNSAFHTWFNKFSKTFSKNASKFKFTPTQKKAFRKAYSGWHKWYGTWQKAQTTQQKAMSNVMTSRKSAETMIKRFSAQIGNSPFNTGQFSSFGFPTGSSSTSKTSKTKRSTKPSRKKTSPTPKKSPWLKTVFNSRGKFTIWVGTSPSGSGSFPTWASGAVLQFRHKGGKWNTLSKGSSWPFIHVVGTGKRTPIEYRAAYVYKTGKYGPWSKTSSMSFPKAA